MDGSSRPMWVRLANAGSGRRWEHLSCQPLLWWSKDQVSNSSSNWQNGMCQSTLPHTQTLANVRGPSLTVVHPWSCCWHASTCEVGGWIGQCWMWCRLYYDVGLWVVWWLVEICDVSAYLLWWKWRRWSSDFSSSASWCWEGDYTSCYPCLQ